MTEEEEFMFNFIKDVCEKIGPRQPFTEKEKEGALYIQDQFKRYDKNAEIEDFSAKVGKFLIEFPLAAILYIISAIAFIFAPLISLILMLLAIIFLLLVNVWNIRPFYMFGKIKQSQNIIGKVPPKNKVKKIVIIGGHHDSAFELRWVRKLKQKFMIIIAVALLVMFIMIIFSLIKLILGGFQLIIISFDVFAIILLIGIIGVFPLYLMVDYNLVVEGANDNLSGVAVCFNLLRKYSEHPLNNIELRLISFGAEEGGRNGSQAYAKRYETELKNSYTINLDTIAGKGEGRLVIINKEITIPHSKELVDLLANASKSADHPMDLYNIPIAGGTDSWSFSKRGLKATSITGLSEKKVPEGWHCREDTPDIIDPKKLKIVSDVCVEFLTILDKSLE